MDADAKAEILRLVDRATEHFDLEQSPEMAQYLGAVAERIEQARVEPDLALTIPSDQTPNARIGTGLQAIQIFLDQTEEIVQEGEIFLIICLAQAVELMEKVEKEQKNQVQREGARR